VGSEPSELVKITSLPPEFYTQTFIVAPSVKIKFDLALFVVFIVLQSLAMVFIWGKLLWIWFCVGMKRLPKISSYPLFDAAFKARVNVEADQSYVLNAGSSDVIRIVKDAKTYIMIE